MGINAMQYVERQFILNKAAQVGVKIYIFFKVCDCKVRRKKYLGINAMQLQYVERQSIVNKATQV